MCACVRCMCTYQHTGESSLRKPISSMRPVRLLEERTLQMSYVSVRACVCVCVCVHRRMSDPVDTSMYQHPSDDVFAFAVSTQELLTGNIYVKKWVQGSDGKWKRVTLAYQVSLIHTHTHTHTSPPVCMICKPN